MNLNKKYHCLACEIARNKGLINFCICKDIKMQNYIMKSYTYIEQEVNHFNNIMSRYSIETNDVLTHEILQLTIKKANKYENYQKAINEVSVILRAVIEMRPTQKTVIDQAATEAGEKFLEAVEKVQSNVYNHIDIEKYAGLNDIQIPGGPILGKPTITCSRPRLGNINL